MRTRDEHCARGGALEESDAGVRMREREAHEATSNETRATPRRAERADRIELTRLISRTNSHTLIIPISSHTRNTHEETVSCEEGYIRHIVTR